MGNAQETLFEPMSVHGLLYEAKRWLHEINKMNIMIARGFNSIFRGEMPDSETVSILCVTLNSFALNPCQADWAKCKEYAEKLVSELSVLAASETAEVQGA